MNKNRRAEINKAIALLEQIKGPLEDAKSIIESAADEEREYYDNMPENMQSGERGEQASAAADALEEVKYAFDEVDIDDLIGKPNEAQA